MSGEALSTLSVRAVPLTPNADQAGKPIKLKVFWRTTSYWTDVDIQDFQAQVPAIVQRLIQEQYWDRDGSIQNNRFTCEDFALRVLSEFAASRGLPVKLVTGTRTYRNMEVYNAAEHDRYVSHMYGFAQMVMLTYGAPDMQRVGKNVVAVAAEADLLTGDLLAQAHDRPTGTAHHIQVVVGVSTSTIDIRQGNTSGVSVRPVTTLKKWLGSNMADPQNSGYAGMPIEKAFYKKSAVGWDYTNVTHGASRADFLKVFEFYRWNFMGFNK